MSQIDLQDVSYTYSDGFTALHNVTIQIEKGERVAILGPNGAGKSTLFRLLNGLLLPSDGKVIVDGLPVEKKNFYQIRAKVGMVFQDSDDQLFNATVRQEVAFGLMNQRLSEKETDTTVSWALDMCGISGYAKRSPYNLSGGEKKRVALASVLAMKPDVLVLDEPTAALDPHGVTSIINLFNEINRKLAMTLIFASHDADIIPLLADRVYLMNEGKMILTGSTAEVFSHKDVVRRIGLRLPRVAHLAEILGQDETKMLPLTLGQAKKTFILKPSKD